MRKEKYLFCFSVILCLLLLAACAAEVPEETQPPVVTQPTAATLPPETEPVMIEEPEPLPEARRVEPLTARMDGRTQNWALCDDDFTTTLFIPYDSTVSIESSEPFSSLYLLWNVAPGTYFIQWEGGSIQCGANGFLHEYVELPQEVTKIYFRFSQQCTHYLCDVYAYTAGSPPEEVQVWKPPCTEADILVFPTHSDDDALFFGALISYYAIERQLTVQTAFMVKHHSFPHRDHERLNGLWAMGVRHYPILGKAPDSPTHDFYEAKSLYMPSDILGWQVEQIRRFRPMVVVGHDLQGEYGNGGHKVNAYYLTQAIQTAADPRLYPVSANIWGTWQTPKLYLHLYPENPLYLDITTPMEQDPLNRTPLEAAQEAFSAHDSQQGWGLEEYFFSYDCSHFGLVYSSVGPDTSADVMEHVFPRVIHTTP